MASHTPISPPRNEKQPSVRKSRKLTLFSRPRQAQTLEQRRRNAKFVKEQDARRGKAETDIKKKTKEVTKSPISPFWLGESTVLSFPLLPRFLPPLFLLNRSSSAPTTNYKEFGGRRVTDVALLYFH
jgi:hypothetical protein